jgi:hypothetical protein
MKQLVLCLAATIVFCNSVAVAGRAPGLGLPARSCQIDTFRKFLVLFFPELKQRWVDLSMTEPDAFSGLQVPSTIFFVSASLTPPDCGVPGQIPSAQV